jgi:hypothetical protein
MKSCEYVVVYSDHSSEYLYFNTLAGIRRFCEVESLIQKVRKPTHAYLIHDKEPFSVWRAK